MAAINKQTEISSVHASNDFFVVDQLQPDGTYRSRKVSKTNAGIGAAGLSYTAENVANKSTDGTLAANSDTLYPSQQAVKTYTAAYVAANGFTPEPEQAYDGLCLDSFESYAVGAITTMDQGVGFTESGVASSSSIVSRTTHGGFAQKRLSITGPGEIGRRMPWLGKWNALRIGLLIRINGSATFDSQFSLGVCSGTSLMFGAGALTCLNSVSICQYDGVADDNFTYSVGTQNNIFVSSTYEGVRRTGGVDAAIGGSFTVTKMTAPANEPSLACYMAEIIRPAFAGVSAVQYTYEPMAPNTTANTEMHCTRDQFKELMNTGRAQITTGFPNFMQASGSSNFNGTTSETNGVLDTINFWWQNAANPFEIAMWGVRKLY